MSMDKLKTQISQLKQRIDQLDQFGYEDESKAMTEDLRNLETDLEVLERAEFERSQLELEKLLKDKEEKPKRTRRRRKPKVVEETPK